MSHMIGWLFFIFAFCFRQKRGVTIKGQYDYKTKTQSLDTALRHSKEKTTTTL